MNARPDCDWAGDKVDVFKSGCREQSHFVVFIKSTAKLGASDEAIDYKVKVFGCRSHAPILFKSFLSLVEEFRAKGEKCKAVVIDIVKFPDWEKAFRTEQRRTVLLEQQWKQNEAALREMTRRGIVKLKPQ